MQHTEDAVHTIIDCELKCSSFVADFILRCTAILPGHTWLYTADLQNGLDKSHSTLTECFLKDCDSGRVDQYLVRVTAAPEYRGKRVTITHAAQCKCVTSRKLTEVPGTNHNPSRFYMGNKLTSTIWKLPHLTTGYYTKVLEYHKRSHIHFDTLLVITGGKTARNFPHKSNVMLIRGYFLHIYFHCLLHLKKSL